MFLLDSLLMAPGKAVLFLFEEMAKKAQEEFLDDETVKQELQDIYAMLEAGKISEQDFEAREYRLVERLQQIALAKLQEMGGAAPGPVIEAVATPSVPEPEPIALEPELKFGPPYQSVSEPQFGPADAPDAGRPFTGRLEESVMPELKFAPPNVGDIGRLFMGRVEAPAVPELKSGPAYEPAASAATPVAAPPVAAPLVAAPAGLTMAQVVESATRGLAALKLKVSAITSVARAADGWRVTAELVERRGVPDTSDLLGVYEMQLDHDGTILQYERTRMRRRCDLSR